MSTAASVPAAAIAETLRRRIAARPPPQSTYRLQFHGSRMTFRRAAEVVGYLHELGISHLYAAPCRRVRAGSPHGYAIVDYNTLDPALGTEDDYQALVAALGARGMGQILDIVPNHMSTAAGQNAWWTDLLENGPSSPYADFFDVDWDPVKEELHNRLLLPVLGQQYGEVLESGQIRLEYREGAFLLRCYEQPLPLDPKTYPLILRRRWEELKAALPADAPQMLELESILTALDHLPDRNLVAPEAVRERQREKEVIEKRFGQLVAACLPVAEFVDTNLSELNGRPDEPASFDDLHRIVDAQVYRLSHWMAAGDEINYRRFFDINELAAVSTEVPGVFEASHQLVLELLARGDLDGLRVDHIDGLFDPTEYLWRLQHGFLRAMGRRALAERNAAPSGPAAEGPAANGGEPAVAWPDLEPLVFQELLHSGTTVRPLFILVEKILGPQEPLPKEWPVAGTTGYDFSRAANGLFVDWDGFREMARIFDRFLGRHLDYRQVVHESKVTILRGSMSSELQLLARRLNRLSERHRRFRDFTLNTLRHALREIVACFEVYRTYLRPQEVSERDRHFVLRAVAQAKRRNPDIARGVFDFVRDVLLFTQPSPLDQAGCRERELFVGRFQQVTSPVMAKGVEDTAGYRYFPLSSLSEVGDDPAGWPVSVEDFHRENAQRRADWPFSLLGTTTHDTKRSEDVRARINVLSEIPRDWRAALNRWTRLNRRHQREVDGEAAPCRQDEYLFYQALLGIWPAEPPDPAQHAELVARLQAYMEKATREAKLHTSWVNPHPEYDAAVRQFVAGVLDRRGKNRFVAAFGPFHQRVARWGLYNALSQVVLKLTSPGVPDIYQGQELWDYSLTDPDNRREVDFDLRRRLLSELEAELRGGPEARLAVARRLAAAPADPRLKLFVTWQALGLRRQRAALFGRGQYVPLAAAGPQAEHVCAFAWHAEGDADQRAESVAVVVPRRIARLTLSAASAGEDPPPPLGPVVWHDTHLAIPFPPPAGWTNLFTGQHLDGGASNLPLAQLLADFPAAVLVDS